MVPLLATLDLATQIPPLVEGYTGRLHQFFGSIGFGVATFPRSALLTSPGDSPASAVVAKLPVRTPTESSDP